MSVHNDNLFNTINQIRQMQETSVRMLKVMHHALLEIAESEHSLDAGIAMRAVAADALITIDEIGNDMEVTNNA